MKRIVIFCLLAALLSGCSVVTGKPEATQPPVVTLPEPQIAEPEVTEPELTQAPTEAITVTYEYLTEGGNEYAIVTGWTSDNSAAWVYETGHLPMAQMARVSDLGQWQNQYYIVEDGAVVALDVQTGDPLWENADFVGAPASSDAFLIDSDGTVYLCGFFGPDFFAVSADGATLKKIDSFDSDYFWAHKLEKQGDSIVVYFSGGPEGDMGPEAYSFSVDLPLA